MTWNMRANETWTADILLLAVRQYNEPECISPQTKDHSVEENLNFRE